MDRRAWHRIRSRISRSLLSGDAPRLSASALKQLRDFNFQTANSRRTHAPRGTMRPSHTCILRLEKSEGAGNAGRPPRPQPRVQNKTKHTSIVTTVTPVHPAFPTQWFTAYFVLSPAIGLVCHRRLRFRRLDAGVEASGPHDFAVRKPALSSLAPPASTASRPASVTCATPLCGTGRRGIYC
jgi:hypothetical protein